MDRRSFLTSTAAAGVTGLAGCLGGGDTEKECLPEDPRTFFEWDAERLVFWAPEPEGVSLEVPRRPSRPSRQDDQTEDRDEDRPTHWVHLTYQHDNGDSLMLSIWAFSEEEFASNWGSSAQGGKITYPASPQIDAPHAISGSRNRYAYRVLGETEAVQDKARELFLAMPCIEEEHIQDQTW